MLVVELIFFILVGQLLLGLPVYFVLYGVLYGIADLLGPRVQVICGASISCLPLAWVAFRSATRDRDECVDNSGCGLDQAFDAIIIVPMSFGLAALTFFIWRKFRKR